jgi:hypothetical protein
MLFDIKKWRGTVDVWKVSTKENILYLLFWISKIKMNVSIK